MIDAAAAVLAAAKRLVALTGAGVSAESGIPTFRGEGGVWRKYDPAKTASIGYFRADPAAYWTVARERGAAAGRAVPNAAHRALAELERSGRLLALVTQNTDGLHRDAGSRHLIELHGSGREVVCLDCGRKEARVAVQARLADQMPPRCTACDGRYLKPTVVLFGEPLPAAAINKAIALAQDCDAMLVVGSSLAVYPAAQLPLIALEHGAQLVIVNAEPTPFDHLATVVVHGRAGDILPALTAGVGA